MQEVRHKDRRIIMHDVLRQVKGLSKEIELWALHSSQVSEKAHLKGQILLQARRTEIFVRI